jgi:flotillin
VDKLISSLPEIVRAMSAPLSQIDKITIVSTGDGAAAGANKITGDMAMMAAQVPALFEALSGMKMSDLLSNVKQMRTSPRLDGDGGGKGAGAGK